MKRPVVIAAVVAAALVLGWYALLWSPKGAELAQLRHQEAAAEQQAQALQSKLTELEHQRDDVMTTKARLATLQRAVPDVADLPGFLVAVSDAAARSGVSLRNLAPAAPAAPTASTVAGAPTSIAVAMNVRGGYLPVWRFVRDLLALDRAVVLDGVQVAAGADPNALDVALTGRIFTNQAVAAK
jgi:Tfp pilus assembly protein PilO